MQRLFSFIFRIYSSNVKLQFEMKLFFNDAHLNLLKYSWLSICLANSIFVGVSLDALVSTKLFAFF